MKKLRVYLDSTILITYVFGAELEPERFNDVSKLIELCKEKVELVTSLYSVIELYNYPIFNFSRVQKRLLSKYAILKVLLTEIEIAPLLQRETKIIYSSVFEMDDKSDVPHAISAFLEKCDYIVTYDTHFERIKDKIKCITPKKLLKVLRCL